MEPIQVCMLGDFSLCMGDTTIRETDNRSRRVWGLLAFLICHRGQAVSQHKLIEQLWGSEEVVSPENTLRILLHRTRSQLDQLFEGAGHKCLLRKDGSYCWNPDFPLELDCERFETLCQRTSPDSGVRLQNLLEALALYQGEFLSRQSSQDWVIPIATHFQNLFLGISMEAAQLLFQEKRYEEALQVCRRCLAAEPYFEPVCRLLMQTLGAMNNPKGAAEFYEELSKRMFDDFGIRPDDETRAVYRAVVHSPEERTMTMDEVLEHTQEPEAEPGALVCDYDYFKMLCYAQRRSLERSGTAAHVALISISPSPEKPLSKRSMSRIAAQLSQVLRTNLRRGDVISRCSASQYVVMLQGANYENSCMVCRRCLAAFTRAHPHVSIRLHYLVHPLTPSYHLP